MTEPLFRDDPYLREATGTVVAVGDGTLTLDRSIFYAAGGGQPGDTGRLLAGDVEATVSDARYGADRATIALKVDAALPEGETVTQELDWTRRHRLMRMHTALHLLSVALPYPVTGGQIGEAEGRLDFDIPEPTLDKDAVNVALGELVAADHPVTAEWITEAELDANPELVKTMAVQPPRGSGRIRLIRIGNVDLQPCGGTHVRSTAEVGRVAVAKIEKKGRQNRRVRLSLSD